VQHDRASQVEWRRKNEARPSGNSHTQCHARAALIAESPRRSATVTALEPAETLAIYREEFEQLHKRHPEINEVLSRFLANEIRTLNERLLETLYVPVEKRVLRRLVELAALYPGQDGNAVIALTQEAIAELAGASRATVNQVLRSEKERGTIELQRGRTRIVDLETLQKRAR
jgi:CRP/FNR family cyclic AMP-dependent transcriptional regulator